MMMKNIENFKQVYERSLAKLKYDYATQLMSQISDDEIIDLYTNNNVFQTLSGLTTNELLEQHDELLDSVIETLEDYLEQDKPLTKEEFDEMSEEEVDDYITYLLNDISDLYEAIQMLENMR